MKSSSSILIIYTGGTIGMVMDPETGQLKPFTLDNIVKTVPELNSFDYEIHSTSFGEPIDSSNVTPEFWIDLCQIIEDNYLNYDGFVILHGTDTMAYTASALSFMLSGLNKPVVFTGSQLPIGMIRTDGKENLLASIEIASEKNEMGEARVPEVCIYFDSYLYRGNRTHKSSTQNFEAFSSPNYPPLAQAGVDIVYKENRILPLEPKRFKFYKKLDRNIQVVTLFPGQPLELLNGLLNYEALSGLVLRTYGAGNSTSNPHFIGLIEKLIARNVVVLNVTQCAHGKIDQNKYASGSQLAKIGVIGGKDITLEAALTKMMVSIGNFEMDIVKHNLNLSLRGEISE